jgi:dTDP-4-dehydrorhamnose 3,5-epimerase
VLDDARQLQLFVPIGFAHGFCVITEFADVVYKCSSYYDAATEAGFAYDDPAVGIEWPDIELTISPRDRDALPFGSVAERLRAHAA